eukprot:366074-Chlamydomonas_euryale.AAC.4
MPPPRHSSTRTPSPRRCGTSHGVQAMRDLKAVAQVPDVELAASAAMITCHEAAKVQDTEAIMELQDKIDVSGHYGGGGNGRLGQGGGEGEVSAVGESAKPQDTEAIMELQDKIDVSGHYRVGGGEGRPGTAGWGRGGVSSE